MIRKPSKEQVEEIVNLHLASLRDGVLYQLGKKVLSIFYEEIINDKNSFILVYEMGASVIGVAASTKDADKIFKNIIKKHLFKISFNILQKSIKYPFLPLRLLFSKNSNKLKPELLFLFVEPSQRGRRIGEKLVDATSKEFKKMGIRQYKIMILSSNNRGIRFYEKIGFMKIDQYKYLGEYRDIYKYDIKL